MKPLFTIEEIFDLIEKAETLTDLVNISVVLTLEASKYNAQANEAFLLLMEAKKDIILNNDTLPQKE